MSSFFDRADYRVQMETRQWLLVDGTMDNEVSSEAEDGDPRGVVDLGNGIRQAGWDQNPGWPRDRRGFDTWPTPGQRSTMTLTGAQWDLVVSALDRWSAVADSLGTREEAEEAEEARAIATLIRTQLVEQGWSTH